MPKADLETYLGTLTSLVVYSGDDIYFTNSGSISIENAGLTSHSGDCYNYITFDVSLVGKRYAFVNSITIVNEVAVINYTEDIWSTYGILNNVPSFELKNSLLAQIDYFPYTPEYTTTERNNFPRKLPIAYQGHNAPTYKIDSNTYPLEEKCYVLVVASMYKLASPGVVNERWTSNYLLKWTPKATGGNTPYDSGGYTWNIDNTTLEDINTLVSISSDTQVRNKVVDMPNWYYEIIDVKIIPQSIGMVLFNNYLYARADLTDYGLHPDFTVTINKVALSTGNQYATFDTDIDFCNLMMDDWTKYIDGDGNTKYTYNGINPALGDSPMCRKTIKADYKVEQIGNYSRTLPFEADGLDHYIDYYLITNQFSNRIIALIDNSEYDLSSDFTFQIPVSAQSADITQQQAIAHKTGNATQMIGMVQGAIQTGLSMGSQFVSGVHGIATAKTEAGASYASDSMGINIAGTALGGIFSLTKQAIELDARNAHQYIANKALNVDDTCLYNALLGGLRELQTNPSNETLVNKMVSTYGYLYKVLINNKIILNNTNVHYARFSVANVYGDFSQDIARQLEQILENGVILLHQ